MVTILIAISLAFLIRKFVIEAYRVPNSVMKPTLIAGDHLFVAKWLFEIEKKYVPSRGDVVVFSAPAGPDGTPLDFIKRVVGLPGDQVEVVKGFLILNGKKQVLPETIHETFPSEKTSSGEHYKISISSSPLETPRPEKVPENSVFVLGDFRADLRTSTEKKSRKGWGIIPLSALKGKALWIWLSLGSPDSNSPNIKSSFFPHILWDRMFRRIQ